MSGYREDPTSPPRRVSRRQVLRAAGVAGGSLSLTGRVSADDTTADQALADSSTSQQDRLLWRFQTGDWVTASPTVVGERVYIGSHDGYQYALDAETGSQAWRFGVGAPVERAPAVLPTPHSPFEGPAVFCSDREQFYAVDGATSRPQWSVEVTATSPVLTADTLLLYGGYPQRLRVSDGVREWRNSLLFSGWSNEDGTLVTNVGPPSVADGQAYIGMLTGGITALSTQTGTGEWGYSIEAAVRSSPTVHDGRVFAGDTRGTVHAVETAERVWDHSLSDETISATPTVANGTVFVGSQDGHVYALDTEDGEERWRFETGAGVHSSPTVAGRAVFVGSQDGHVYALDADTGEKRWRFDTGETVRSSPTVVDGVLFVGGWDGNVYALDAGVSGSSEGTRIEQGVLGHHHSHVGAAQQTIDPVETSTVGTPPENTDGTDSGGLSSSDGEGPGFGITSALAGLGAGYLWARRQSGER